MRQTFREFHDPDEGPELVGEDRLHRRMVEAL